LESLKRNLVLALGLSVAVYLVIAILSDLGELAEAFGRFNWALAPVILGLVALSYVGRFFRWAYYLRLLGVSLPLGQNAAIFAAGLSMTVSPGKLGEVLKSVFIRRANGAPVARTAPAVVAERVTDGTGMISWGLLGALTFDFGRQALLVFLIIMVGAVATFRSKRLSLLMEKIFCRLPLLNRLAPHLSEFHGASNELLALWPLLVATVISFLAWGLEILGVYLCVVGMGVEMAFLVVVFIFAVSSLGGALSMVPGGIGVAEAGLVGMFSTVGRLSGGLAGALTFLIRLATLWFATLVGIVGLLLVRRSIGEPVGEAADEAASEAEAPEDGDDGTRSVPRAGVDRKP
jgi:uncharacterized protein (TIRG00374 family)